MLADYTFYKKNYKGIVIADANSYEFFGERASDELALYSSKAIFNNDETAQNQLKRCACRIADILYSATGGKGGGKKVTSESVAGYYSVSYGDVIDAQVRQQVNSAIALYIGRYIIGARKVLW